MHWYDGLVSSDYEGPVLSRHFIWIQDHDEVHTAAQMISSVLSKHCWGLCNCVWSSYVLMPKTNPAEALIVFLMLVVKKNVLKSKVFTFSQCDYIKFKG